MAITTHVLDTSRGRPASGIAITLEYRDRDSWARLGQGETDADGRLRTLTGDADLQPGIYRLSFDTSDYFRALHSDTFFPEIVITFHVREAAQHYHVPLLLSPFGYSTYRGS